MGGFLGDQGLPVGSEGHRAQQLSKDQVEDNEVDGTGTGSSPLVERSRSRHNEGQEQGLGCVGGAREPWAHTTEADPGCGPGGKAAATGGDDHQQHLGWML